jgi:hypothetical protein
MPGAGGGMQPERTLLATASTPVIGPQIAFFDASLRNLDVRRSGLKFS